VLSGKPVELGRALPEGWWSWQAGGCGCLAPGWYLSQRGGAPVLPQGDGAGQGLMGRVSLRGGGLVIPRMAGAQQDLKGGGLERGETVITGSCGTGSGLGSGADRWWGSQWSWIQWCS
jgi:hypothetical protein